MFQIFVKGKTIQELRDALVVIQTQMNISPDTEVEVNATITTSALPSLGTPIAEAPKPDPVPTLEVAAGPTPPLLAPVEIPVVPFASIAPVGDLDSENLPWDKRIHTVAKTQTKLGMWKIKRGTDPAVVVQVKAELTKGQAPAAPIPPAPIDATTPLVPPMVVTKETLTAPLTATLTPPAAAPLVEAPPAAAPTPPAPLASPSGHSVETFVAQFPMIIGSLLTEQKVTEEYLNELKTYFQVEQIWSITDVQKAEVFKTFVDLGLVQQVA